MGNSGSSASSTLVVEGHVLRLRVSDRNDVDSDGLARQRCQTGWLTTHTIQTYTIQQPLGEPSVTRGSSGGSGGGAATTTTVFLAEDDARRKFTVQVTRAPNDDSRANAQAAKELKEHARLPPHPHLLAYVASKIDGGSEGGHTLFYLVTEYCPRTVRGMMEGAAKRREPLHEREILNIFTSATAAVA